MSNNNSTFKIDSLELLKGNPIIVGEYICLIYPINIGEIAKIGTQKFFRYLNLLTFSQEDVNEALKEMGINSEEQITPFQFIVMSSRFEDFSLEIKQAFSTFIREKVEILLDESVIAIGGETSEVRYLTEENFSQFQQILILQNNLEKSKNEDRLNKPSNAIAERIIQKIKKNQKKSTGDDLVEFADLVSCLAARGNGINIFNVWDLNYYSFNDQFQRVKMIEEYDMNVRSILAGADPKKVELKHWIRSIK